MATAQVSENLITIKGSTEIVTEFFSYSINTILYQRGIYPAESFKQTEKYGLNMLVTDDDKLNDFFTKFLQQLSNWLLKGEVQKLVLVITGIETQEVVERWAFEVHAENGGTIDSGGAPTSKSKKEIMAEIQAIIRQITASVSFLPLLEEQCAFDLLVYTDKNSEVPPLWEESDPRYIKDSAEVRLRSFSTKVHKVDAMVAYKNPEADI
uniref:HORMA domain-containing protein n=1 Tax=Hyaloperonospora arabidopsidis (strain Emoy2) TaxID=559515 RepID=M4C3C3_HYAAE